MPNFVWQQAITRRVITLLAISSAGSLVMPAFRPPSKRRSSFHHAPTTPLRRISAALLTCTCPPGILDLLLRSTLRSFRLSGRMSYPRLHNPLVQLPVLYEDHKRSYLNTAAECSEQGVLFVPFVAESSGGWGTTGFTTLHKLAKASGQRWGKDVEASLSHLLERLSVAIRSAHARAVLRRAGGVDDLAEDPLDAAATALVATTA